MTRYLVVVTAIRPKAEADQGPALASCVIEAANSKEANETASTLLTRLFPEEKGFIHPEYYTKVLPARMPCISSEPGWSISIKAWITDPDGDPRVAVEIFFYTMLPREVNAFKE